MKQNNSNTNNKCKIVNVYIEVESDKDIPVEESLVMHGISMMQQEDLENKNIIVRTYKALCLNPEDHTTGFNDK